MESISLNVKNFINENKNLISEGNWSDLFEESRYQLSKYQRQDLALLLKDAGIIIPIQEVFPKEKNFTHYIEDDMLISITPDIIKELNKQFNFDFTNELKEYPFNKVLEALNKNYFNNELNHFYDKYKNDLSPLITFKYIIFKPNTRGWGNVISFGIDMGSKNRNNILIPLESLSYKVIDWMEGFGIGYNKDEIEKLIEENFEELMQRIKANDV